MSCCIREDAPSTSAQRSNVYHMNVQLFVLDMVRQSQDHPKFGGGLKEKDLIDMLANSPFACGDLTSQIKMAINELQCVGFLRFCQKGYRTLGPFAKLALSRNCRQFNATWNKLCIMHVNSVTNIHVAN